VAGRDAPLWIITRDAVACEPGDPCPALVPAQVWAAGAALATRYADLRAGVVDLPAAFDERTAARLVGVLTAGEPDQLAIRTTGTLARRLVRAAPDQAGDSWAAGTVALIEGDAGPLREATLRWLAAAGAHRLLACSPPGAPPVAPALVAELARAGAAVTAVERRPDEPATIVRLDGTRPDDPDALDAALAEVAGGVTGVTAAAVRGLDGLLGSPGAAARDAAVEATAVRLGVPLLCLTVGPCEGEPAPGLRLLPPAPLAALLARTAGDSPVVADVDWDRYLAAGPPPALLRELAGSAHGAGTGHPEEIRPTGWLRRELASLDEAVRPEALREAVRAEAAAVLGHATAAGVEADSNLLDLGFSSFTALELATRLSTALELTLAPAATFDHPTPDALVAYLGSILWAPSAWEHT